MGTRLLLALVVLVYEAAAVAGQRPIETGAAPVRVAVTGCVQKAPSTDASAVGTTDTTDEAAGTRFLLTSVRSAPGQDGAPATRMRLAETYRLLGQNDRFAADSDHQVEVIGTVLPTAAATETSSTKASAHVPLLRAETVKTLGSTCLAAAGHKK